MNNREWALKVCKKAFDNNLLSCEEKKLVWILDESGLIPEVVVMLVNWLGAGYNKPMSYIESMAIDWQERGINTVLKAEEFMKSTQFRKRRRKK